MSPYREPSARLEHWDTPRIGDLVRLVSNGAIGDILDASPTAALVFFDFTSDAYFNYEFVVIDRASDTKGPAPR